MLNSDTASEMILVLDNYIFSLIPKNNKDKPLIKAAEKISKSPTKHILSEIQKDICVTERTLQRIFEKNIGVSPNQFRKIHQFSRSFRQLNNRQFQNLSDIAYDNDYADQKHT